MPSAIDNLPAATSESQLITLRGMRLHVRLWGVADAPMLFLLHG